MFFLTGLEKTRLTAATAAADAAAAATAAAAAAMLATLYFAQMEGRRNSKNSLDFGQSECHKCRFGHLLLSGIEYMFWCQCCLSDLFGFADNVLGLWR